MKLVRTERHQLIGLVRENGKSEHPSALKGMVDQRSHAANFPIGAEGSVLGKVNGWEITVLYGNLRV